MDALVTVRYRLSNLCDRRDLRRERKTFDELVRWLIQEEGGVGGLADEYHGEIVSIEEVQ